jgi:ribosomal protein S18 acetylase RimI-like enzyme
MVLAQDQERFAPIASLEVQKANPRVLALYHSTGFRVVREQVRRQIEEFAPELEDHVERPMCETSRARGE